MTKTPTQSRQRNQFPRHSALLALLASCLVLAACNDERSEPSTPPTANDSATSSAGGLSNRAPTIWGTPPTTAAVRVPYSFTPRASDPDGDTLRFTILGKPAWAQFDVTTGRLYGTPPASATGRHGDIRITVSDGSATDALAAFDIQIRASSTGSATLSWEPPTQNEDGSRLRDLAGYVIRYGQRADSLDKRLRIVGPGITSAVVENLSEGTWYFTLVAVNAKGAESRPSRRVSKTIG